MDRRAVECLVDLLVSDSDALGNVQATRRSRCPAARHSRPREGVRRLRSVRQEHERRGWRERLFTSLELELTACRTKNGKELGQQQGTKKNEMETTKGSQGELQEAEVTAGAKA
eukprot:756346-Hanusia_phi.AAC.2